MINLDGESSDPKPALQLQQRSPFEARDSTRLSST